MDFSFLPSHASALHHLSTSPPPPLPPPHFSPMETISDELTADELEVAGILADLRVLVRVPIERLRWGECRGRSTGDLHRGLLQPSTTVNCKLYRDEKCGVDGWHSPDTPLQFPASEDDDAGRGTYGKLHLDVLDKPHKKMKRKYKELQRDNKKISMKVSKMREKHKELQQINVDLKARLALQDRLQSNNSGPDMNRATITIPLPSPLSVERSPPATTPGSSDHVQPQKSCRRQPIPDLNMPPEEVLVVAAAPTTTTVPFSGFECPYGRPKASKGSATHAARKRRMDIRRSKNSISKYRFGMIGLRHFKLL